MSQGQLRFEDAGGDDAKAAVDLPEIYIASALSRLVDVDERRLVQAEVRLIRHAVQRVTSDAVEPWNVRVYAPIDLTSPWGAPTLTAEQIFNRNFTRLHTSVDALIIHGHGPGMGAGQEFEWASRSRMPILYLRAPGHAVSRQIVGSPADLVVKDIPDPDELEHVVAEWLRVHRVRISRSPERRRARGMRFEGLRNDLAAAWHQKSSRQRMEILSYLELSERDVDRLLRDAVLLGAATHEVVEGLSKLLVVPPMATQEQAATTDRPVLTARQARSWLAAAAEYAWDDATTDAVHARGLEELSRGGTRRFRLDSISDWLRIQELLE